MTKRTVTDYCCIIQMRYYLLNLGVKAQCQNAEQIRSRRLVLWLLQGSWEGGLLGYHVNSRL